MDTPFRSSRPFGIILVLIAGCCWGFHGVLIKKAYAVGASFIQVFFAETLFATLFFACFARSFLGGQRPSTQKQWGELLLCGLASVGVGAFLFLAFSVGPVAIGATLLFLYLPQVYGFSVLRGEQQLNLPKSISLCLLLVGAAVATDLIDALSGEGFSGAIIAATLASTCYALIFLLTPRISTYTGATFRAFSLSVICFVSTGAMLLAFPSLRNEQPINWLPFLGLVALLGLFGQTLSVMSLMKGIPLVGSSLAGALASIELPIAVLSSALFLGEEINFERALGVAFVFAGIILFYQSDSRATSIKAVSQTS